MTNPNKLKGLEDIVIDFNEYLEIVSTGLEQLENGVQAIVDNFLTEYDELATRTNNIIGDTKKDLEQGRTVTVDMLKPISSLKSPTSTILITLTPVSYTHLTLPTKRIV